MRPLNDCIKEDMTKADKMFKKLGYKKDEQDDYIVYWKVAKKQRVNFYNNQNEIQIEFNFNYKTVEKRDRMELDENGHIITMKELQAINEKCKELGWIKEKKDNFTGYKFFQNGKVIASIDASNTPM